MRGRGDTQGETPEAEKVQALLSSFRLCLVVFRSGLETCRTLAAFEGSQPLTARQEVIAARDGCFYLDFSCQGQASSSQPEPSSGSKGLIFLQGCAAWTRPACSCQDQPLQAWLRLRSLLHLTGILNHLKKALRGYAMQGSTVPRQGA